MALAFAGKAVASSAISAIVRKSFDYLEKYSKLEGMKSVQERLERTLPQVEVVFDAIDMEKIRGQSEALDAWLWQLRDAVEEAEDVLDEVEYYKLEKKVETSANNVSSFVYKCKRMFIQQFNATFNVGTCKKMIDAMKKLDEVAAAVERFHPFVDRIDPSSLRHISQQETSISRETSSFLFDEIIIGRDTEKDQIVEWLVKQESDDHQSLEACSVTTFALVGIGGMGKTTLVKAVYNDQRVKQCFDQVMWVCVSKEFDVNGLTRKIVQEATGGGTNVTGLNTLQTILQEKLSSKKFLLVFDDVWNDNSLSDWETLLGPLKFGQMGSKILLTTRMQSVIDVVERVLGGRTKSLRLEGLQDKDLLVLLNKHAFLRVNPDDHMNLQEIGKKIIRRLSGCPLAAKVLGGLLNSSMDSIHWNRILQENIHNMEDGNNGVMKVLRLSYNHLPAHLQACFRYCSLFREDYQFRKDKLVDLWMGSGLIQISLDECQRPEDVGERYLDILASKSFFELRSRDPHKHNLYCAGEYSYQYYLMHDLLHELACTVSKKECFRVSSDDYGTIPATVRHISISIVNHSVITDFSQLTKLRTLFIYFDKTADGRVRWHVLKNVLKVATKLRVLRVDQVMRLLVNLPKEFDNLMHLRCLFGIWIGVRCPSSVYKLYHLEMIRLKGCLWDSSRLRNLINLRRLDYSCIQAGPPPHIGHLTSLQYLEVDLKYERMSEIRDLNDLRCLHIVGIQNSNVEDSKLAKLAEKKNLSKLSFSWDNSTRESGTEELLLDNLQPHTSLTKLKISGYSGTRSPCWMGHPVISNLVYINIAKCRNWQNLPALGRLPALRYLHLRNMHAVKRIDHSFYGCEDPHPGFPSLELLFLSDLPALEEWVEMEGRNVFPQLKTLSIEDCRALRNIPALPSMLANLKITDVGLDTFPAIFQSSETALSQKPLLSSLKIFGCPNLVTFTRDQEYYFHSLEELCIKNCKNLLHFPVDRLQTLQFLATFSVVNCPKLMAPHADVSLPSSIRKLHIRSCGVYATCLLNSLCSLTSLTTLHLNDCVMTTPAPDDISFPSSIRNLYISSLGVYENRLLHSMCSLSSLDTLSLSNCITAFPSAQVFMSLTTVRCLEIAHCSELASLDGIEELTSLAQLIVIGCDKLIGIPSQQMLQASDLSQVAAVCPSHMGKLHRLRISDPFLLQCEPLRRVNSVVNLTIDKSWNRLPEEWLMQNCNSLTNLGVLDASQLEFLPSTVARLSSLETLELRRTILIQSLPELPASLRTLQFLGSHPVLIRRCQKNKGHDWHKIAHILKFRIDQDFPGYQYVWSSFRSLRSED